MLGRIAAFVISVSISGAALAAEVLPYAGGEAREIKALSPSDIEGLLAGRGMGYAMPAELNGYPGPAHVLELAEQLELTAEQRSETEAIFARMEAAAKELGAELVAAERKLDEAFRSEAADETSVLAMTSDIGAIEARLRAVHLNAHLQQTRILSDHQVALYITLRGYGGGHGGHGHHH